MPHVPRHPIQQQLIDQCRQLSCQTIIIACSGGVDSMVLLDELARLKCAGEITQALSVIYINHGISENASHWQAFVKQQCLQRDLAYQAISVFLPDGKGLEDSARQARYAAFAQHSPQGSVVFTAHHQDDQVETLLLALKRGAGVKGLGAMQARSRLSTVDGEVDIVRPLLSISRQQIELRAQALGLSWIEDESNADNRFDRNFIRNQVLPSINQRWPSFSQTATRSIEHCQQAQQLIEEVAEQDLAQCRENDVQLNIETLLTLSDARRNFVLRQFLASHQLPAPSSRILMQISKQLLAGKDKSPQVKVGSHWLRRYRNRLVLTKDYADLSNWQCTVELKQLKEHSVEVQLPDNLGRLRFKLSQDKLSTCQEKHVSEARKVKGKTPLSSQAMTLSIPDSTEQMTLSFVHNNPSVLPDYRQHSRPLKKVLQELSLAPWQRQRIPFVYQQPTNALICALGLFVCQSFITGKNDIEIEVVWSQDGELPD
ncbi:tRNA lysidine(34) synthetase TilS [Thalassotalea ganghwensis]